MPSNAPDRAVSVVATFFSEAWNDASDRQFMRPIDRLVLDLIADPALQGVVVADPYRSRVTRAARRVLGRRPAPFDPILPGRHLVQPLRWRVKDSTSPRTARAAYRRYGQVLAQRARALGLDRPALITCSPLVAAFADVSGFGTVTYYARDDFDAHPSYRPWWPLLRQATSVMRTRDLAVCAVSAALMDQLAPSGRSLVVPNGVEPAEWVDAATPPSWFTALAAPRVVYVGSLDERLDPDLVAAAAAAVGDGTVLLLGPTMSEQHVQALASIPRVVVHPHVGRHELTSVIRSADACVLPHVVSGLTRAMSPLKLYEYVAGGCPTVATDLPPVRGVHQSVRLATTADGFAAGLTAALAQGRLDEAERMRFVAANSWSSRFGALKALALAAR